jgi:polar amino acid transport system substrate-binding protein
MKKGCTMQMGWRWLGAGCLAVLACGVSLSAHAQDCVKTVRWYDDAPYTYRGLDGNPTGLTVDLLQEALGRVGCKARWVELPWARALAALEGGQLDILPGALKTLERQRFAYFSRAVNRSPNVLFMVQTAIDKYPVQKLADLMGTDFRLGIQLGVAYGPEYEALQSNPAFAARLSSVTLRRNAWNMMALDRLDGMIADETTGLVELQQLGLLKTVVKTGLVVSGQPAHIAISQRTSTPEFVQSLDRAIGSMLDDGSFRRIRERYVPCPVAADQIGCR